MNDAFHLKCAREIADEVGRYHPMLDVTFLRPWIGIVDVIRGDAASGEHQVDESARIHFGDPHIRKFRAATSRREELRDGARQFDCEEIPLRIRHRIFENEVAFTGADLDFQRRAPREDSVGLDTKDFDLVREHGASGGLEGAGIAP